MGEAAGAQSPPQPEKRQQEFEPWLGKAKKLDDASTLILSHYEHRIIKERTLLDGDVAVVPKIKYRTKYEAVSKERLMAPASFNPTRLGNYLILSDQTPDAVKEQVARKMRSDIAKKVVADLDSKRKAGDTMHEQLQTSRKASKVRSASSKEDAREGTISKYIAVDAAMPTELLSVVLYYLVVFVFMARLPFPVVSSYHFVNFLWSIRPAFAKHINPRYLMVLIATDLLDEVYEETISITADALNAVPGRPTLGMDGHKEGKHRHVETVTRAKLGISTFAGAEYMRTTRTSGQNLSVVALKFLTTSFIALVADNTGNNTGEKTGLFAFVVKVFPTLFCLGCYVHVLGERADASHLCPQPV
jgi:hypothetical protein